MTPSMAFVPVCPEDGFSEESVTVALSATFVLPVGGEMVSVDVRLTPPYAAESTTEVAAPTEAVLIVNEALFCPAGTVTVVGAGASEGLLLESRTIAPPVGAALDKVTVA